MTDQQRQRSTDQRLVLVPCQVDEDGCKLLGQIGILHLPSLLQLQLRRVRGWSLTWATCNEAFLRAFRNINHLF